MILPVWLCTFSPGVGAMVSLQYAMSITETPIPTYHSIGAVALVELLYFVF